MNCALLILQSPVDSVLSCDTRGDRIKELCQEACYLHYVTSEYWMKLTYDSLFTYGIDANYCKLHVIAAVSIYADHPKV